MSGNIRPEPRVQGEACQSLRFVRLKSIRTNELPQVKGQLGGNALVIDTLERLRCIRLQSDSGLTLLTFTVDPLSNSPYSPDVLALGGGILYYTDPELSAQVNGLVPPTLNALIVSTIDPYVPAICKKKPATITNTAHPALIHHRRLLASFATQLSFSQSAP